MFLYRDGGMIDLNHAIDKDPGGIWPYIYVAQAINDAGVIVGYGTISGRTTAWILYLKCQD